MPGCGDPTDLCPVAARGDRAVMRGVCVRRASPRLGRVDGSSFTRLFQAHEGPEAARVGSMSGLQLGNNRRNVATLLAACDLIIEDYAVQEIASWFEMPILANVPVTSMDLYERKRMDLVFEHASGQVDPEQVLTELDSKWRARYSSDFEVFRSGESKLSIRPKAR